MSTTPHSGLQTLDYLAVVGYLAFTVWIVHVSSRKQSTTDDFFLAGRRMPWLAVGLSIMATLLSTITYLGSPGEMIAYGVAYFAGYLAIPIVALVVVKVWIPFFMRLHLTSAYEYLERRFDYRARLLGGLLFLLLRLGWMSVVVYTASLAMVEMAREPWTAAVSWLGLSGSAAPLYALIAVVGIAATIYTCLGGMRAVIWTDVVQAVMLFGGVFLIIGYVAWVSGTGPVTWWQRASEASPRHMTPILFSTDISVRTTVVNSIMSILFWNLCTHVCDQVVLQRYFTTSSLKAARNSFLVNIVTNISIGLLLSLSGLALLYFYLEHPDYLPEGMSPFSQADKVMPYFYSHQLAAGFGGLILASFLCDAMQTVVSGVNSIAAIATKDVIERVWPDAKSNDLTLARWVTIGVGGVTTVMAVYVAYFNAGHPELRIFDLLPRMFNMFLGPLAALFLIGMFVRRATARVAIGAVLAALLASFVWSWWAQLPTMFEKLYLPGLADAWRSILGVDADGRNKQPTIFLAVGAPCLAGLAAAWLMSLVFGSDDHPGVDYTWKRTMLRPPQEVE
ncbi:MAG TPA: sodium/solute symporter [Pirellulaceae bacterium]|nr:sodium/solute symporter [Pirellulaceae bacterium]